MTRVLGVDPGTKTFDLALVEDGFVTWEKSIPTEKVAQDPSVFIDAIMEKRVEIDYIAAPSGYGTPLVCNNDIRDPLLFATEVLLLSQKEKLFGPRASTDPGSHVYRALALTVKKLWEENLNACYIPAVIHLPTVPSHRKYNKIDMGTADKMAATFLGALTSSLENKWSPDETSILYVEMGYGYNAVVKVEKGKITDGHGGTLVQTGFLTIGGLDAEIAAMAPCWSRNDNYAGGVSTACGTYSVEEALEKSRKSPTCKSAFESMYEGIVKNVASMMIGGYKPREIIVSGRLARYQEILDKIVERLNFTVPVVKARNLPGARFSKEAAQGYAAVLDGVIGGRFKEYADNMGIKHARGTSLTWVFHPSLKEWRSRVLRAYVNSLTREAVEAILTDDDKYLLDKDNSEREDTTVNH